MNKRVIALFILTPSLSLDQKVDQDQLEKRSALTYVKVSWQSTKCEFIKVC